LRTYLERISEARFLTKAQLQGATLNGTHLQGADLRSAAHWNVVADQRPDMSLVDLRGADFNELNEATRARLLSGFPEPARLQIKEKFLSPGASAKTLPRVATPLGPMLSDLHAAERASLTHSIETHRLNESDA
jgi:uncharacterized protein YjbI with pentapeptide repeats